MRGSRYQVTREAMTVHLVEDRRADVSPWGLGNSKLGPDVFTYSKHAGRAYSCPGSTDYCERLCYAKRMAPEGSWLHLLYTQNGNRHHVLPELPNGAELVRGHVSGDFDSVAYIRSWTQLASERPEVLFWFCTRSWRVRPFLLSLERLRALPNVQLWASMDRECEPPPDGWRRAWLDSDPRVQATPRGLAFSIDAEFGGGMAPACPEETGVRKNCRECGICFEAGGGLKDLVFLEHRMPGEGAE